MRLKGILITLVVVLGLVFAVTNWQTITTNLPINLLFFTLQIPLGLALLVTAIGLSALFFVVSLVDRAGQLRQITQLERQLEQLRARLDKRRLEEIGSIETAFNARCDELDKQIAAATEHLDGSLRESLADFEMRSKERVKAVEDRVILVRNELAAYIAEAEDSRLRAAAPGTEEVEGR